MVKEDKGNDNKRLDALLGYAVMHEDEAEAERLREELCKLILLVFDSYEKRRIY